MDLKGFSVSKERDRTQQVGLCRKEYSEHSSNPYILWFYLEPLSASAIKQLSQAHHMMKALHRILISPNATEEESGGILYSVPGIRGKPAMLGQGPSVCWPNVLSLDVTFPEYSPKPVLQLARPTFHFSCYSSNLQIPCFSSSFLHLLSLFDQLVHFFLCNVINAIPDPPGSSQLACPHSCAVSSLSKTNCILDLSTSFPLPHTFHFDS